MAADRRLTLETGICKASVVRHPRPQQAFGIGRIAPQKAREPAHRPMRRAGKIGRCDNLVLREQRAQHFGLGAVEHAAARGALAPFGDRHDDAVQGADVLLRRRHAREDVAHVDDHGAALLGGAEIFDPLEFGFEHVEE